MASLKSDSQTGFLSLFNFRKESDSSLEVEYNGSTQPPVQDEKQFSSGLILATAAAAAAKSLQSCPTLCDPIDGSPQGSPVPGILQARTWSALPFPSPIYESEK